MSSISANADKHAKSIVFASSSHSVARHALPGESVGVSSDRLSFSDPHLSQALEAERQEAAHHLAILANSIFASVGC
jgi:hypothetical protein